MSAKQEILNIVSTLPEIMNYKKIVQTLAVYESDKHAQDDYINRTII